ncbi:MAG: phosphoserine aminotransferase [Patiriisocius sp.]|jgi:phosphoserine aminotransferase
MKVHNFSAGPCILPQEVLAEASKSVIDFQNSGLSLIEMSHRSAPFVEVMENARSLVKKLLNVPEDYEILFLQGGASLGFYISAINLLGSNGKAAYINTGTWSNKAIKEAKLLGEIVEVGSSKDKNFSYIPKDYKIPSDCDYIHYTSNNTIVGTQFHHIPNGDIPLVCDMSSDIFSKKIDVSKYAMIYAGAQKNMGPAGTTLYIVKKSLLGKTGRTIPSMMDLQIHIDKDSMFNTPPVFPIYVSMLTLQWLDKLGGVDAIEKINDEKARIFYEEVDRNPLFRGLAEKEDRSKMNPTFELTDESKKEKWDSMWKEAGISGINGHRSVGGYRASMYNAMPLSSVEVLVDLMKKL